MIEPGDKAWIRVRALNNALQKHPDPAISQENQVGIFGAQGRDREYFDRYAGIRRVSGDQERDVQVDVLELGLPYGKKCQRVGVRVWTTLSDDTDVEVVVHTRSVEGVIEREAQSGIYWHEYWCRYEELLAEIATDGDAGCETCHGTGTVSSPRLPHRLPCTCTGVTHMKIHRRLHVR